MEQKIEHMRHTLAHLLAAAVLQDYPHAKLTLGPAINTGFYYDIDFGDGETPGNEELKDLQKSMKKILNKWTEHMGSATILWSHHISLARKCISEPYSKLWIAIAFGYSTRCQWFGIKQYVRICRSYSQDKWWLTPFTIYAG